jgi:acetyltransferase-like isoleucine patch superfamily enzyme
MKGPILWFVNLTRPFVWRLATAYGLRVDRHCVASGQNPLVVEDTPQLARHHIPRSVQFNTRSGRIFVGANTVFGEDVKVLTGKHANVREARLHGLELHHVPENGRDITIGRGCYIGSGAIIIGPVTIGDYAVVGAGSVVTKSVPASCFVGGVPAKLISRLDSD